MKTVYPVLIKQEGNDYLVYAPDIDRVTEGRSFYDALYMARDLISTFSLDSELPDPSPAEEARRIAVEKADSDDFTYSDGILTYIDIEPPYPAPMY